MELTRTIAPVSRWPRLLSVTVLSVLTLTACIDEGCNLVGPSEAVGSHAADGMTVMVTIYFDDEPVFIPNPLFPNRPPDPAIHDDPIEVRTRQGVVSVPSEQRRTVVFQDVKKGDIIEFEVLGSNSANIRCTWDGTNKLFTADAFVFINPAPGPYHYEGECRGWNQ